MSLPSLVSEGVRTGMLKVAERSPEGAFVEVGVYKGGTAWYLSELAERQGRQIFLYDTFTGIPYQDKLDKHRVGDFSDTSFEKVRDAIPYARVIQGLFPDSAIEMPPVAFVHLDCDQYRSIRDACLYLMPRMVPGASIWFDDAPYLAGAKAAVDELFGDRAIRTACGRMMVTL